MEIGSNRTVLRPDPVASREDIHAISQLKPDRVLLPMFASVTCR